MCLTTYNKYNRVILDLGIILLRMVSTDLQDIYISMCNID